MTFEEYQKRGMIRKATPDRALIHSLMITAQEDLKYLKTQTITALSARKIMTNYYEVLRSILEAVALQDGYKFYSHEAFVLLLKQKDEELYALQFDRLRKTRNGINYYGKNISIEEVQELVPLMISMIETLQKKYLATKVDLLV